jgi:CRISPR-associated protein Cmr6
MAAPPNQRHAGPGKSPSRPSYAGRGQGQTPPPPREPALAASVRPLYNQAARGELALTASANRGLWYDKFCDRWKPDWSGFEGDSGKRDWIAKTANIGEAGDGALLKEAVERCQTLAKALQGQSFRRTTAWRFVSGLGRSHPVENGFAWRHDTGAPYLPGSSLKGLARAYARDWEGLSDEILERIFGPKPEADLQVGSVMFLDALPVEPVVLQADVMTPHYGPWNQNEKDAIPGDWHSPTPIPFLTVAPGQTFLFAVLPRDPSHEQDRKDRKTATHLLAQALETLGAGAKTAVGYGQFVAPEEGKAKAGTPSVGTATAVRQAGGRERWAEREAIVDDEVVQVIEDRGETLVVRFDDGEEKEVNRSEARRRR